METTGVTIQDFLQIYQAANSQFETVLTLIGVAATFFGVIVAVALAFFAIRQINVDREIRRYRDDIKRQKESATEVVEKMMTDLKNASAVLSEAKGVKHKLEEEIKKPPSKETKEEIRKLQQKIERLEEDITYRRGALSASPGVLVDGVAGNYGFSLSDSLHTAVSSPWQERCKKCGKVYEKPTGLGVYDAFVYPSSNESKGSKCPYCGNIN